MPDKQHARAIEEIRQYFKSIQSDYAYHCAQVSLKDAEKSDLERELELGDLSYQERGRLATKLRAVLKERRVHKDNAAVTEEINGFLNDHPKFLDELDKLISAVKKIEKKQANRSHSLKTKADLSADNEENAVTKPETP